METFKNIMSWIWEKIKVIGNFLYTEFRQYPQYGWPFVAFIAGFVTAKLV